MTPQLAFQLLLSQAALLGWLCLAAGVLWRRPWLRDSVAGLAFPLALGICYAAIAAVNLSGSEGGFGSLEAVRTLFASDRAVGRRLGSLSRLRPVCRRLDRTANHGARPQPFHPDPRPAAHLSVRSGRLRTLLFTSLDLSAAGGSDRRLTDARARRYVMAIIETRARRRTPLTASFVSVLHETWRASPALTCIGIAFLVGFALTAALGLVDPRTLQAVSVWGEAL